MGDCIQSVINQTYPSIELVLVDDCGGDKSVDIINDFIKSDFDKVMSKYNHK